MRFTPMSTRRCADDMRRCAVDMTHKIIGERKYRPTDLEYFPQCSWPCGKMACNINLADEPPCWGDHTLTGGCRLQCTECEYVAEYLHKTVATSCECNFEHKCACGDVVKMHLTFGIHVKQCPYNNIAVEEHISIIGSNAAHSTYIAVDTLYERRVSDQTRDLLFMFAVGLTTATSGAIERFVRNSLFDRNVLGIVRAFVTSNRNRRPLLSQLPACYSTEYAADTFLKGMRPF